MNSGDILAVAGGAAAVAVLGALYYLFKGDNTKKYLIIDAESLVPGKISKAKFDDREVLVIKTSKGQVRVTGSKCPHYKLSLAGGVLNDDRLVCNYHGACFNTATGDIEDGPSFDRIPVYPVTTGSDGKLYVTLPAKGDLSGPIVPHTCPADHADARNFVIVGAGPAGQACAETLRQEGYTGRITMLTRESVAAPYDRVKLSKDISATHDKLALRNDDFYRSNSIQIRTNTKVTGIKPDEHLVVLEGGETLKYDKLMCATGGPPRMLPGAEKLGNIFPLRDVTHSSGIKAALDAYGPAAKVVIIGSSFIGMEAASYLLSSNSAASITVVGMEAVPFERVLGAQVGALMQRLYESKKVKFHMKSTLYTGPEGGFLPSSSDKSVVGKVTIVPFVPGPPTPMTSKPKEAINLDADIVIIGAGIIPATEYLRNIPDIKIDEKKMNGVKVDQYLCAGPEDVFVGGDIAVFPYRYATDPIVAEVRIEHWDVAIDHGRVIAHNMLGKRKPYVSVPFFWTSQVGRPVRSAGYCFRIDETIVANNKLDDPDPAKASGIVFYVQGGRVASVVSVGLADNTAVAAMELFRLDAMPSPDELRGQATVSLPDILRAVTTGSSNTKGVVTTTTAKGAAATGAATGRRRSPARVAAGK